MPYLALKSMKSLKNFKICFLDNVRRKHVQFRGLGSKKELANFFFLWVHTFAGGGGALGRRGVYYKATPKTQIRAAKNTSNKRKTSELFLLLTKVYYTENPFFFCNGQKRRRRGLSDHGVMYSPPAKVWTQTVRFDVFDCEYTFHYIA